MDSSDDWEGKRFAGYVSVKEYQGKKRNEIKNVYPPGGEKKLNEKKPQEGVPF